MLARWAVGGGESRNQERSAAGRMGGTHACVGWHEQLRRRTEEEGEKGERAAAHHGSQCQLACAPAGNLGMAPQVSNQDGLGLAGAAGQQGGVLVEAQVIDGRGCLQVWANRNGSIEVGE